jgi:integrase
MATRTAAAVESTAAWNNNRALQLARQPGKHSHPTATGFFIRVSPAGKAVFGYKFRDAFKVEQTGTLGEVAAVSDEGALDLADALLAYTKLRAYHKAKASPGTLTVQKAFEDWTVDYRKRGGDMPAPTTIQTNTDCYNRYLRQHVGDWLLGRASTEQWRDALLKVKAISPSQARIAYWMICSIYRHYNDLEALTTNPVSKKLMRGLFASNELLRITRKTRVQTIDLAAFVAGVMALRNKTSSDAIMVMLLTSWRKSGVMQMRWDHLNWEQRTYTVRPLEAGWKKYQGGLALNDYVLGYLEDRRKDNGEAVSPYIFPARHGKEEFMQDVRTALQKACSGLGYTVSAHDLRRTFATIAEVVLDGNLGLVGRLMAHAQPGAGVQADGTRASATTAGYIVRDLKAEAESGRRVAEAILEIADVLPMSDETEMMFKKRGIDIKQRALALVALDGDEDEDEEEEVGIS